MHLHKYEKIWLIFGIGSLSLFLAVLGFGAFWKGTHPQSHGATIDPENIEAHEAFQPENLGLTKVDDDKYIVNIAASAFHYDLGVDEDGKPVKKLTIPKGSTVLFQITTKDVVHGFNVSGTNVNMMVEPGYISRMETVMKKPGEYTVVCNEYCGVGHHLMYATVEVTE
ncbi:cytochrome c oxidase subunit II [Virgibacillus pantothenticus]|uniref:cytochrome c oxidase subunit II n=1 Tax=Virgibacillus pantothenticus TaxID=1473 RepID=UPI001C233442|nr:cytochrome c oxidase subunit II [Virgibacillus pantothenticus]MBU8567841.1 cytochrome c oxidase subunit II [Virgibacillus pantothenticus]MBU8601634.1 cytochrome c oxidase subunit II [Virgibacillus pantothenticus]MBU8635899.1 cytochrome c oxidase subunit II [Virgibacillus pantothenticus]MBU8641385.1 cytochrome c oxidase subunit II [Virgibacillus pantothenticus]MBU8646162.1 cytochrome c oxidase subunit II [Virgibacillus pantothenticus]